jgi:hypothetical protein
MHRFWLADSLNRSGKSLIPIEFPDKRLFVRVSDFEHPLEMALAISTYEELIAGLDDWAIAGIASKASL